jgi:uncharacterized membrane protein YdjX (TVP38/TMEM64 family)
MRVAAVLAAVAALALGAWQVGWDASELQAWIGRHRVVGALLYVVLVAGSVVLLPFSSLPLLPIATRGYGVVLAALLSAAGWWIGALVAFELARLGRGWLERVVSLEAVDRAEARIPADIGFGGIVLLRMVLPVDLVSFALGLLKRLSFATYALASLVGILPFAFVWSYAGGELGAGRYLSVALVALGLLVAALLGRRWYRNETRRDRDS